MGESCANIFLAQAQSKHYFQVTWLGRNKLFVRCKGYNRENHYKNHLAQQMERL